MSSKVSDFIELATQAAAESGIKVQFAPYTVGEGVQIVAIDDDRNRRTDLDRFLIELTSMADKKELGLQLALNHNDIRMKNEFRRFGFEVLEDSHQLQMERGYNPGIIQQEMDFEPVMERRTLQNYLSLIESERRG